MAEPGSTDPSTAEPAVVRLRIDLAYDGASFHGWADQPGLRTVQGELESAIATVLRIDPVGPLAPRLTVAGRTDTGVHARGQVAHVDLATEVDPGVLAGRLRRLLADDLVVRSVVVAPPGFDARFAARCRRYSYRVCDEPAALDPLARGHVLSWPRHLDHDAMNDAAEALLGEHDFAAFCKRREGAGTVRALQALRWSRTDHLLTLDVRADAFCHHMVRSLVGCLLAVGEGRRAPTWPADVLTARVRDPGVLVVPPHGLTLEAVEYPADDQLAARARHARTVRASTH